VFFAGQTLREFILMLKKNIILVLFIFGVSLQAGCCYHSSNPPMLPKAWYGLECNEKSLEDNPEQSKLHVMVMYRGTSCVHTTLRVYCRSKGPLFWDPAGSFASRHRYAGQARRYMRYDAPVNEGPVRENDVLVEKGPSLNQYLDWRKRIDTDAVEIFEFNISDEQAEEIWTVIRYGTKRSHPKGRFSTNAMGGLCGLSVAKYLHRFAEDIVKVDTVWHPHSLAEQLYKEKPDRVIVYRDKQLSYYIPSENHVE
jgi:hypothetical protein